MHTNVQRRFDPRTQELRKAAGVWLRELREKRGLTQRELAAMLGVEYYTFVSQLETGRGRVPPDSYELWAAALEIDKKVFVKQLMSYYDPQTYSCLFADEMPTEPHNQQASAQAP